MDLFLLRLELIDFTNNSIRRWRIRRTFIGFLLILFYIYAIAFFTYIAMPDSGFYVATPQKAQLTTQDGEEHNQAQVIIKNDDYTEPKYPLMLMVTFGFIGGVFVMSRTFVRTSQKNVDGKSIRKDVPVSWYLTRPLQGALMAIFIYYAFRAGQLVFYSMEGTPSDKQINVYTLSLVAIIAGAFSEQAFEKLHAIASGLFKVEKQVSNTE